MIKRKIFFRADGNNVIGLGHVIRSLALVEMLIDYFECVFIIRNPTKAIFNLIERKCESIISINDFQNYKEEAKWISENLIDSTSIIILDGYYFDTEYQKIIKNTNCRLICIDDLHSFHFVADIVINHAPGVTRKQYSAEPYTKLFLGEKYALLRKQFLLQPVNTRNRLKENNIFICFGGADYYNFTLKAIKAVEKNLKILNINVVLGNSFLFVKEIEEYKQKRKIKNLNIYKNLNADEMYNIMNNCTLAICPASSVAYESLALKINMIIGYTAENQKDFYNYLVLNGNIGLGSFKDATIKKISTMINEWFSIEKKDIILIDGKSPQRFLKIFKEL